MRLTNRLGLPDAIVQAVRNDSYSSGDADMSVTTLLKPVRIVAMERSMEGELVEDAADRIWSLMGQVVHGILERADTTGITERRLTMEVEGWKISGQMDRYQDGVLQDYKVVTGYKFKGGGVPEEYEAQINVYAELLRQNGHEVKRLEIVGILRDWSKLEARRDHEYPQQQVVVREVKLWEAEKVQAFVRDRVILHKQAQVALPECSPEERWARPGVYALMKVGQKKAVKLYDNAADADAHASTAANLLVVFRPGQNVRCSNYCSVAHVCTQFSALSAAPSSEEVA